MTKEIDGNEDQISRFRKMAKELNTNESDDALDKVFGKLDLKKPVENDEDKDDE